MASRELAMPDHRLARHYLSEQRWLIRRTTLDVMVGILDMRVRGLTLTDRELASRLGAAKAQNGLRGGAQLVGGVAVLPLYGVIDQKIGSMGAISGGTSVDAFMAAFRQAKNDTAVKAIVIDTDSPGGSVYGVPEAAAEIMTSRGSKPIVAVANPQIASAAFYLCCAASEIVCLPSGEVGSVGVLAVHDDYSEQNTMIGYKPTYVYAGAHKVEFNPDEPLSDDAKNYLQAQIDATYDDFVTFVAKARGVTPSYVLQNFGQGRMLLARDAKAVRMIDRIDTLDATIARLDKSSATRIASRTLAAAATPTRAGHVPKDVSEELAPKYADWTPSELSDFTDTPWSALSDTDKNRIAGHYAYSPEMPPAAFDDLKCQHHRPSDGKVVPKGMDAAYAELDDDASIPAADKPAVRAHLDRHDTAIDQRDAAPVVDPANDSEHDATADDGSDDSMDSRRAGLKRRAGFIPKDVSEKLAPKDTPWSKPNLSDFTSQEWSALSDADKRHIAGHYAYAEGLDSFGQLHLPHHRPSDGAVVYKGVTAALGRLDQTDGIPASAKPEVKAHLERHEKQFEDKGGDDKSSAMHDLDMALAIRKRE